MWIGWSDSYWIFAAESNKDAAKAEQILKEGLATPDIADPTDILERLETIYQETSRAEEAAGVRAEINRWSILKKSRAPHSTVGAQIKPAIDRGGKRPPLAAVRPQPAKSVPTAPLFPAD